MSSISCARTSYADLKANRICRPLPLLATLVLAGILMLAHSPARAIDVTTEAELRTAIDTARTTPNTRIVLLNNITLTADPPAGHTNVTILGNNNTLSGHNQFRR